MRTRLIMLTLAAALAAGGIAAAQAPSPADAVKARQANFKQVGGAAKTLNEQSKSAAPDMAAIKDAAGKLKTLSAALPTWFPAGSGKSAGVKTAAKDEIWSDAAGFSTAAKNLADAAAKLDAVAQTGDADAVKAQFQAVGMACGACHKVYREKEQ